MQTYLIWQYPHKGQLFKAKIFDLPHLLFSRQKNSNYIEGKIGSGFGSHGKGHMRITFLPDIETLEIVYNLFEEFLK